MTRLVVEANNSWAIEKVKGAINTEISILARAVKKTKIKLASYEKKYGKLKNRKALYGKVDDMDMIEWEGEVETLHRLQEKFASLKEMNVEYK